MFQKNNFLLVGWLVIVLAMLTGCKEKSSNTGDENEFLGTILEINEQSALVEVLEGESIQNSADQITFGTADLEEIGAEKGDVVRIVYTGDVMESYPAQVQAVAWKIETKKPSKETEVEVEPPVNNELNQAGIMLPAREGNSEAVYFSFSEYIRPSQGKFSFSLTPEHQEEKWYYDEFFSLERYQDGEWKPLEVAGGFCGNTNYYGIGQGEEETTVEIDWGAIYNNKVTPGIYCMSKNVFPEDQTSNSLPDSASIEPPDLNFEAKQTVYAVFEIKEQLGLNLVLSDITPTGLSFQFERKGGNPSGELEFGQEYFLDRLENNTWVSVDCQVENLVWEELAYIIPKAGTDAIEVDWNFLYGALPPGEYRFGKEVMDFREAGDFDIYLYQAVFTIEDKE